MDFVAFSSSMDPNYCPDCGEDGEDIEMHPETVYDPHMQEPTEAFVCPRCGREEYAGPS